VVLSQYVKDCYAAELVQGGARGVGCLLKDRVRDPAVFIDAVRWVASRGSTLDPEVVQRMVDRSRTERPLDQLTLRENEVLTLMAEGRSHPGIGEHLAFIGAAVERHVTSSMWAARAGRVARGTAPRRQRCRHRPAGEHRARPRRAVVHVRGWRRRRRSPPRQPPRSGAGEAAWLLVA
jgi:hypothetical protein